METFVAVIITVGFLALFGTVLDERFLRAGRHFRRVRNGQIR